MGEEDYGMTRDVSLHTAPYCKVHYTPHAVGLESSLRGWEPSSNNIVH